MEKINTTNLDIKSTFQNFYIVPDYQREYVWHEKNVNQLLEDINEEFSVGGTEYFIGSTVVCKNDTFWEVIDGQQRLTTLFLSLCAFKKVLKEMGEDATDINEMLYSTTRDLKGVKKESFKLSLQYENTGLLIRDISEDKLDYNNLRGSAKRIADAYNYAYEFLKSNFKDHNSLQAFLGYFLNNVKLIQIETPGISDALKIFETINERGVGLNPMDLLKNLIFRQVEKEKFEKLKNEWKEVSDLLEKNKEKPLRFLRYFIMANYEVKNARGEEIIREDEIYDWIIKKENIKQCDYEKKPFEFVKKIQSNVKAYTNFLNGKDKEGDSNLYLDNITRLGGSFRQHLILLLAAKDLDLNLFNHLAKQIETLVFYYIITREATKEFERNFSKWAKEIKKIKDNDSLNKFIASKILPEINSKNKAFEVAVLNYTDDTLQKYRLKYILAKLTQYVDLSAIGTNAEGLLEEYMRSGIEVEHILPQKPKKELREKFEKENPEENYEEYVGKLGNLTLLEKPINIVAANNFFELKKEEYKKSKFLLTKSIAEIQTVGKDTSVNRTNEKLLCFNEWNTKSIDTRQNILLRLAKEIWNIKEIA